jgi:enoyl-[acyl-carrier protein] reductase III
MDLTLAGLDAAYKSQVHTMVIGCQACASLMPTGGRIIGITHAPGGKTGSWQPWAAMGPAKAALEATIRYFAVSFATKGITVNAVSPGVIEIASSTVFPPRPTTRSRTGTRVAGFP